MLVKIFHKLKGNFFDNYVIFLYFSDSRGRDPATVLNFLDRIYTRKIPPSWH